MKLFKILTVPALLISCLALFGCSDDSPVAPATIDKAPPAVPTGLQSYTCDCVIKLSWDPNVTNTDIAGYRIYRMTFSEAWLLTPTILTEPCYIDRAPLPGQTTYGITSIDTNGNESAWSLVVANQVFINQYKHRQ